MFLNHGWPSVIETLGSGAVGKGGERGGGGTTGTTEIKLDDAY